MVVLSLSILSFRHHNFCFPDEGGDADVLDEEAEPATPVDAASSSATSAAGTGTEGENTEENKANKLTVLLEEKLLECVNKQKVDDFCVQFSAFAANKASRRRLVQALIRLPRSRSELAPMYARIVAILSRLYPDILPPILDAQRKEFHGILKTKKQLHIESKLRNVRYQGEMIKFNLAPPIVALRIFRTLLTESFSSSTIEMLTAMLECCGRYLYLLPYTQDAMNQILEMMLRLRHAKNLDLYQQTLLESAYFAVKPPDRSRANKDGQRGKKELTVVQQYARYLIQQRLEDTASSGNDSNGIGVDDVIRSLRRLPWQSPEERVSYHVMKAVLKVARTKYISIPNLADCLSGLQRYYPNLVTEVVDRVFEEIQRALENPFKRDHQRIHGFARLLGELYNFTALSTTVIFEVLYHLLNFGHDISRVYATGSASNASASASSTNPALIAANAVLTSAPAYQLAAVNPIYYDPRVLNEIDLPTDLFRAQIVCEILNTCGMYYVRGSSKEKLSRFLVYFQRYLLTKQFVPMHVEFTILDTFDNLEELAREATAETIATAVAKAAKKKGVDSKAIPIAPTVEFPRYDSLEAVQKVIDQYEGKDSKLSQRTGLDRITEEEDEEEDEEPQKASGAATASNTNSKSKMGESDDEDEEDDSEDDGESESESDEGDDSDDDSDEDSDEDEDGSDSEDDDDDDDEEDDQDDENKEEIYNLENDDLSEAEAAKMLEKLRIAEEDEEFERAFKFVVQASHMLLDLIVIPSVKYN
jgi:regulator of nonsense transcripts 2